MKTIDELNKLWSLLGDIPTVGDDTDNIDDVDCIEESFLHFPIGTHREEIWHWFEAMNPKFLVGQKMSGIPFDID